VKRVYEEAYREYVVIITDEGIQGEEEKLYKLGRVSISELEHTSSSIKAGMTSSIIYCLKFSKYLLTYPLY
jgi:hypothetical protein